MSAADPPGHVHGQRHAEAPGPRDAVVVADATGDDLCHDPQPEQDEDRGTDEFGGHFADQAVGSLEKCHVSSWGCGQPDRTEPLTAGSTNRGRHCRTLLREPELWLASPHAWSGSV